jgi:hypothetical protein
LQRKSKQRTPHEGVARFVMGQSFVKAGSVIFSGGVGHTNPPSVKSRTASGNGQRLNPAPAGGLDGPSMAEDGQREERHSCGAATSRSGARSARFGTRAEIRHRCRKQGETGSGARGAAPKGQPWKSNRCFARASSETLIHRSPPSIGCCRVAARGNGSGLAPRPTFRCRAAASPPTACAARARTVRRQSRGSWLRLVEHLCGACDRSRMLAVRVLDQVLRMRHPSDRHRAIRVGELSHQSHAAGARVEPF